MPHLYSFRKGWENENLARFILSKLSFVAHPSTVSDDVGSDFFCTLFRIQKEGGHDYLTPKNSFAIQIKSDTDNIDVSNKLQYLNELEIPFFVGVIDQENFRLTIYSGEYIPALLSYKAVKGLEIELSKIRFKNNAYFTELENGRYILRFPRVIEINADVTPEELQASSKTLSEICSSIHKNIASRKSGEYIFEFELERPTREICIRSFAGSGSVKVFRENFLKRLTEIFSNLKWIYEHYPERFNEKEFKIYEQLFYDLKNLKELYDPFPVYLTAEFDSLRGLLDKRKQSS